MMQQPAPQQQGGSSTMMIVIGGVVALLLLCCCGGGIAWFFMMKTAGDGIPNPDPLPVSGTGPVLPNSNASSPGPTPTTDQNMTVTLTIDTATGAPGVVPGSTCVFPIVYHAQSGDLNCQAHATCAGVALYGNADTNGFFPCTFSTSPPFITGADNGTTAADQDPSFVIDSSSGTLIIADDSTGSHGAFSVSGRIRVQ